MRVEYSKREIIWKKRRKEIPDKCTIKIFLERLSLSQENYDVVVNGIIRGSNYIIKKKDKLVLLPRPLNVRE